MTIAVNWDINQQNKPNWQGKRSLSITVNLEIFARVLISRNLAYAKFRENKFLAKSLCGLLA